ncbi:hypothetical protein DIS18_00575 [Algibacter marinivivus]|uniref:Uncharacterized protein n=1 Tax=Algibacter marinivivus TaxID=2100723 RepID=A0A2U2X5N3_9FLAO|nr:hypothetical protein [Algibacter marinivivus]PWH83083.1 hypothetical protein DIS18_00575 [Algibacter marinivivus]
MDKKTINNILSNDLIKISSTEFNNEIISKLKKKPAIKYKPIFKSTEVLLSSLIILTLFLTVEYKIINNPDQTTLILSLSLILIPICFLGFNKIQQLIINQKRA